MDKKKNFKKKETEPSDKSGTVLTSDTNLLQKENDSIIAATVFELIKDGLTLSLGDIMNSWLVLVISIASSLTAFIVLRQFKLRLKEKWGKNKWAISVLVVFALSIIPLASRTVFHYREAQAQKTKIGDLLMAESTSIANLMKATETFQSMQSTLDYQATQLTKSTPTPTKTLIATSTFPLTPTSTPKPDEFIIESLNQFVTMINNEEIAKAYDTLFTQYYRDAHTWSDFEYYWGTQVKKISINIIVSPYIPEDNIVSETNVEITIIIEGREYDPDVFIWNICHYEENNEWLINNFLGSGKDCIER